MDDHHSRQNNHGHRHGHPMPPPNMAQPQYPMTWAYPPPPQFYPYGPGAMPPPMMPHGMPYPQPVNPDRMHRRKSRRSRRENRSARPQPHNHPVLPLPPHYHPNAVNGNGPMPVPSKVEGLPHFPQQLFFQDPASFYKEQMKLNKNVKRSDAEQQVNEERMKQFKRERKRRKKMKERDRHQERESGRHPHISQMQNQVQPQVQGGRPIDLTLPDVQNRTNGHIPAPHSSNPNSGASLSVEAAAALQRKRPRNNRNEGSSSSSHSSSSRYHGVYYNVQVQGYVGRIWQSDKGQPEEVGVFPEELRAAVAVDERLLQLGVDDLSMLNFKTQLERDIALVILLNHHRFSNLQQQNQQKNQDVQMPLAGQVPIPGQGIPSGFVLPPGVTVWPVQKVACDADKLLSNITRDRNGHPNDIGVVLANILSKTSQNDYHIMQSKAAQQQANFNQMRGYNPATTSGHGHGQSLGGPKRMTMSTHTKVASSSRKRNKKKKSRNPDNLVGTTVSLRSKGTVPLSEGENSKGYKGDTEQFASGEKDVNAKITHKKLSEEHKNTAVVDDVEVQKAEKKEKEKKVIEAEVHEEEKEEEDLPPLPTLPEAPPPIEFTKESTDHKNLEEKS